MADKSRATTQIEPPTPARSGSTARFRLFLARWGSRWNVPLSIFVGWRLALAVLALGAGVFLPAIARNAAAPYTPAGLNFWGDRLLGVWSHWDGEWFLYVAQVGYRSSDPTTPFFPLYPSLVRISAFILGGNYVLAGVLVSALIALALFVLFYELVKFDFGRDIGERAALYLAVFPSSFFLAAIYSEGLFLALAVGAFLAVRRYANWWLAGILIGLAAITRNMGILLLVPLGWEWWRQHRTNAMQLNFFGKIKLEFRWRQMQPLASLIFVALPVLMLGGWVLANLIIYRDPLNFLTAHSNPVWNRHSSWPWQTLGQAIETFFRQRKPGYQEDPNLLDFPFWVFCAAVFLVACYQSWRKRLAFSYLLYFAIALVLPLLSPAAKQPLLSFPRLALLAFPVFIILAQFGARWKIIHYIYLLGAALLLGLLLTRFANWYWVA
jgi:hypothetical protein